MDLVDVIHLPVETRSEHFLTEGNPAKAGPEDEEQVLLNAMENCGLDRKSHSSVSSSSSSSSSDEDFFQLDATELGKPASDSAGPVNRSLRLPPLFEDDAQFASVVIPVGGQAENSPPDIAAAISDYSSMDFLGAKQPPPPSVQVMVRSDVPDPYRIPSSVFARTKSTAPMEWSVASNESLFSIHMGNSSFSRDHVILLGKSGELPILPGHLPPTDMGKEVEPLPLPLTTEAANAEAMEDVLRAATKEHAQKEKEPATESYPLCASVSQHSDGSRTSINSFAFPILTEGRSGSMKVESKREQQQHQQGQKQPEGTQSSTWAVPSLWCSCLSCSFSCCWPFTTAK